MGLTTAFPVFIEETPLMLFKASPREAPLKSDIVSWFIVFSKSVFVCLEENYH